MARPLVIEEESGTSRGHVHPHNGYYAASPFSGGGSDVTSLRVHPNPLQVHQSARPGAA